jgi:AcrR family transcriptional regulator
VPATGQQGNAYHHGDLPTALVRATLEIVAECGVHGFSVAEAARRTGVSPAAPYRHFADRDALLAAAADTIARDLRDSCTEAAAAADRPEDKLAAVTGVYVRSAARHQCCFSLLLDVDLRAYRPEVGENTRSMVDLMLPSALELTAPQSAVALLEALRCLTQGYAALLLNGSLGVPSEVCDSVADRAARAARSLASGFACPAPGAAGQ